MSNVMNHDPAPHRNYGFHLPVVPSGFFFVERGRSWCMSQYPQKDAGVTLCWKTKLWHVQEDQNLVLNNYNYLKAAGMWVFLHIL